jgi:hypothetical protein
LVFLFLFVFSFVFFFFLQKQGYLLRIIYYNSRYSNDSCVILQRKKRLTTPTAYP